jgi:hypothetical protein
MDLELWKNFYEVFDYQRPCTHEKLEELTSQDCYLCKAIPGVKLDSYEQKRNGICWTGKFQDVRPVCSYCALSAFANSLDTSIRFWIPTGNGISQKTHCVYAIYTLTGHSLLRYPMI